MLGVAKRKEPAMLYFQLRKDGKLDNTPVITNFINTLANPNSLSEKASVFFIDETDDINYPDFMDRPLFLVSDRLKKIIEIYHPDYTYRVTAFTQLEKRTQKIYWNIDLPIVDCLSEESKIDSHGLVLEAVIDESKIKNKSIFQIKKSIQSLYVIRLDLAESILRRNMYGFTLTELKRSERS